MSEEKCHLEGECTYDYEQMATTTCGKRLRQCEWCKNIVCTHHSQAYLETACDKCIGMNAEGLVDCKWLVVRRRVVLESEIIQEYEKIYNDPLVKACKQ